MRRQMFSSLRLTRAIILVAALLVFVIGSSTAVAQDFVPPEPNRHIYDTTGLLTADEVAMLEQRAAAVEAAGAPVAVYLQAKDTDTEETLQDARDLMDARDLQTTSGARDGVVIFLNLDPDDLRHGDLALVAGETHFDGGNLPQYELDRIRDEMLPLLADEETAEGIATGLDMIANSLTFGPAPPPEPNAFEKFSEDVASGVLSVVNIVGVVLAAGVSLLAARIWGERPSSRVAATPTTTPPDDLIPAAAGALVTNSVGDAQIEATILDLARRGALVVEPEDGKKKVQVRLLDHTIVENRFEEAVWQSLEGEAENGLISSEKLSKVRNHWGPAKQALTEGLVARNWFDPEASKRARPLYIAGILALLVAIALFVFTVVSEQLWSLIGSVLLGVVAFVTIIMGFSYPKTTEEGEAQAQPWRGFLNGVKSVKNNLEVDLDLDYVIPYMVAMNAGGELDKRLKSASEAGYSPLWLGDSGAGTWGAAGFYPYWITFHSSVTPASTSTGGAGASAGSGGSGGSF